MVEKEIHFYTFENVIITITLIKAAFGNSKILSRRYQTARTQIERVYSETIFSEKILNISQNLTYPICTYYNMVRIYKKVYTIA